MAPARTVNAMATGFRHISKRLVTSYIIDWVLILATAAVGGAFSKIDGARHAFSLTDPSLSFPYESDTVSVGVLLVVSIVAPGVITAFLSFVLIPGPTADKSTPKSLIWRRKLWEWNTAWMGLGVSLAGAFMITEGLKDCTGKPRPHLIAVCQPDTTLEGIQRWRVGGIGTQLNSDLPVIVTSGICETTNTSRLRDAFASWPSGHSSFAWAGLLYLTLFLSAKFSIYVPYLAPTPFDRHYVSTFDQHNQAIEPPRASSSRLAHSEQTAPVIPPRNQAAAPPVYLLILAFVPVGAAFFIALSRWFDYHHHGFDIISGSLIGAFMAWLGFRLYHLPIRQGSGWAWGARSRDRAYIVPVGIPSYVGDEGWQSARHAHRDLENPVALTGGGLPDEPQETPVPLNSLRVMQAKPSSENY